MDTKVMTNYRILLLSLLTTFVMLGCSQENQDEAKPKSPKNHIAITLATNTDLDGETPHIKGFYIYKSKGQEVRKEIDVIGGDSWNIYADEIDVVEVETKKVTKGGFFQLWVSKNKDTLYSSGPIRDGSIISFVAEEIHNKSVHSTPAATSD